MTDTPTNDTDTTGMAKAYDPDAVEDRVYEAWKGAGAFHPDPNDPALGEPFTIVIPPPNVTDKLHLGHALNNTIQDILVRWRRMQGRNTLWVPGTDHAGIATQAVVERRMFEEEGLTRHDVGREGLVERIWAWRRRSGDLILEQLRRIGSSCDWQRTRFTLDNTCERAVREAFFRMFGDDLIYRGKRLVNWDVKLQTAVADDEVYHETVQGHLWHMRYPVVGEEDRYLTVATTRPETMLGDTAVAVHPKDERYTDMVGKTVRLPLVGREIPVIADGLLVDPEFGSGCVKVTPAHDPNDYETGLRHKLPMVNVMTPDGKINENGGDYEGLDRFEARKRVVEDLEARGLLERVEDYTSEVGHSDRSKTPVEPYLSDQWFVAMAELAERAMEAVRNERVRFHPDRYGRTYLDWLGKKRDWCISRQLWWGHRIPIWHCETCTEEELAEALGTGDDVSWRADESRGGWLICTRQQDLAPDAIPGHTLTQDPDVLDTWFSSALWPMSTLGWPAETDELATYYPTDVLVTAREIITLWVARMVMMGLYNKNEVPFSDVYIHAMIQDGEGRPMKKSLGNGVDPLDVVHTHGADALRFTVAYMTTETQDVRMPVEVDPETGRNTSPKFDMGRNFCNKLWNAVRFALINLERADEAEFDADALTLADRWILSRTERTLRKLEDELGNFHFQSSLMTLYDFFWHDLCDWYLEAVKPRLSGDAPDPTAQRVLALALDRSLRMLHPYVPFITEACWEALGDVVADRGIAGLVAAPPNDQLITAAWPQRTDALLDEGAEAGFAAAREVIRAVRNVRSKMNIPPSDTVDAHVKADADAAEALAAAEPLVHNLAGVATYEVGTDTEKPPKSATEVVSGAEVYVPLAGVIDLEEERARLEKRIAKERSYLEGLEKKLANENFVTKAPAEVVERERANAAEAREAIEALEANLEDLL